MVKNILALDLGRKSIGISVSRTGILVTPLCNYRFPLDRYDLACKEVIRQMEKEMFIEHIVIGLPRYKSGDYSEMSYKVLDFIPLLQIEIVATFGKEIEIITVDESNSTLEASEILHQNNKNAKQQKKVIDCAASTVILERYLREIKQII